MRLRIIKMNQHLARILPDNLEELLKLHKNYLNGGASGQRLIIKFADFSDLNFHDFDFSEAIFISCDFSRANLENCCFDGSSVSGCNFSNAKMKSVSMVKADIRGAILRGADLAMANLEDADLREGKIPKIDNSNQISNIDSIDRPTDAQNANFSGANLGNSKMGNIAAYGANFQFSTLNGANLAGALLKNCDFSGANLAGATLKGALIDGAIFYDAILTGTNFGQNIPASNNLTGALLSVGKQENANKNNLIQSLINHQTWYETNGSTGNVANFENLDLRVISQYFKERCLTALNAKNCIAAGILFMESQLQGANFENADLRGASFIKSDLRGANFRNARLIKANFSHANLGSLIIGNINKISDFTNADLRYACFDNAFLHEANFANAKTDDASFAGANVLGKTISQNAIII